MTHTYLPPIATLADTLTASTRADLYRVAHAAAVRRETARIADNLRRANRLRGAALMARARRLASTLVGPCVVAQ